MNLIKSIVICSLITIGLVIGGCHKENYTSRDTSGLKPPPPPPPPPVDSSLVMFDPADSVAGWETVGAPVVVTTGQKQGAGYIQGTIATGSNFLQFIKTRVPPLNTKLTVDNGQLTFWLNIPNVTLLDPTFGQIQVSSSGQSDSKRYGWAMSDVIPTLHNGWNQITLDLSSANVAADGGADLSAVNYFKMFFQTTSNVTANFVCGIDAIQFKAKSTSTIPSTAVEIDNCDSVGAWQTVGAPVIITSGQKEGAGYLQGTITTGNNFMQFIRPLAAPVNTKVTMSTGQLQMWFYVPDVTLLDATNQVGQLQFGSANDPDKNRIGWGMDKIIPTLHNGWNHLMLNFRDAYVSGDGGPDLTAMNFLKMFFWTTSNVTANQNFGLDDIKVVAIAPPPPVVISTCDSVSTWQTVGTPVIITSGQKEGAGYMQGTITTGNNFLQFILPIATPINTGVTTTNGQLQFWFNVPDVSLLKLDGQIQFSSANDPDKNRIGWPMANIIPNLRNGWNLVTLNFNDPNAEITGDGGPDLTAMNYFKMFFWTTDNAATNQNFGIDDIIVQQQ